MNTSTIPARRTDAVTQFSVFTPNRLGRLHDLTSALSSHGVDILAVTVLDTSESSIIRIIVDDPDQARELLDKHGFPFTESDVLVVEIDSATRVNELMSALLEAELNVNYLYCFIPHPHGKSMLAFSMEDNELAAKALAKRGFKVLRQGEISR